MNQIDPLALFGLSVLGPMVSREQLARGELQPLIRELSAREYAIPHSQRRHIGEKTIEAWYYAWRREGIAGLAPMVRIDRGRARISEPIQAAVLAAKCENPRRSVRQIVRLLEAAGTVQDRTLSRSAVHRLLQQQGLSRLAGSGHLPEEKRSFTAEFAGSVWYGDVMHGPRVPHKGSLRKTYLVSLIDDASRLVAHSAFCLGETALDIEGVLKQALLKRGVPIESRAQMSGTSEKLFSKPPQSPHLRFHHRACPTTGSDRGSLRSHDPTLIVRQRCATPRAGTPAQSLRRLAKRSFAVRDAA